MGSASIFNSNHEGFPLSYTQDPVTEQLSEVNPTKPLSTGPFTTVAAGCTCGWRSPQWTPSTPVFSQDGLFHYDIEDLVKAQTLWAEHDVLVSAYPAAALNAAASFVGEALKLQQLHQQQREGTAVPPEVTALFEACASQLRALATNPCVSKFTPLVPSDLDEDDLAT
ncbi:hypothetical protein NVS55_40250 (plasmid) [Myxococcus stipitatus]|uniref:hypothetical protein n=1 Tax=Myxococcus stipitatus TaxID=83455 RepID=UPI00314508DF